MMIVKLKLKKWSEIYGKKQGNKGFFKEQSLLLVSVGNGGGNIGANNS